MVKEEALTFACNGDALVGVLSRPESGPCAELGVLVVVGGPQYRVGSHRQFVLLARYLAAAGFAALRFDVRGMGDSAGAARDFTDIGDDIAAAMAAFREACPTVERVVIWGLCDAASAALLYWREREDPALAGLVLLNPWVRSETGLARARVRHYYRKRLLQAAFWKKLLKGHWSLRESLRDAWRNLRLAQASTSASAPAEIGFQARMADALRRFPGPVLFILSAQDVTGQEFGDWADAEFAGADWRVRQGWRCLTLAAADHTFSSAAWRREVELATRGWLLELLVAPPA